MQLQEAITMKEPIRYSKKEEIVVNKKSERITYIDTAKAIAIFLTIVSHSGLRYHPINQFICSFHMPLFFFVAGWTQKNKKITGFIEWKDFLLKKTCTLLVPYILYSLISSNGLDLSNFKYIFYGNIFSLNHIGAIGTIWFLPCMFITVVIYQITVNLINKFKNKSIRYGVLIGVLVIYGMISSYFNFYKVSEMGVPLSSNIALSGVIFMFVGKYIATLYNKLKEKFKQAKNKNSIFIISLIFLIIGMILYKLNKEAFMFEKYNFGIVMAEAWYGNYFIFLINAIICSIGIVLLSMVIDNKFLRYFGKNTLIILYFHIQVLGISNAYITNQLPNGTYKCFVNSIITFLAMGLIIPIINKLFPNLSGKFINEK